MDLENVLISKTPLKLKYQMWKEVIAFNSSKSLGFLRCVLTTGRKKKKKSNRIHYSLITSESAMIDQRDKNLNTWKKEKNPIYLNIEIIATLHPVLEMIRIIK